jgi:hypothetical protein
MSVANFPLELKGAILDRISEDKDLLVCRLISKDFQKLSTPRTFQTLNISRKRGCYAAFTGIPDDSQAFAHVKEINFRALETRDWDRDSVQGKEFKCGAFRSLSSLLLFIGDTREDTISMFSCIPKFSNLHTLRLYFPDIYEEEKETLEDPAEMSPARSLQIGIFKRLAERSVDTISPICELEIQGLLAIQNEGTEVDGFSSFLKPLSSLYISLVTNDSQEDFQLSDDYYRLFWQGAMTNIFTATENLTSLTLISDIETHAFANNDWHKINLPKLEHLRLSNIVFLNQAYYFNRLQLPLMPSGVEEFVIRHKLTLTELDLSSCLVEICDEDPNPRYWANIWNNFEKKLTRLRSFKFNPPEQKNNFYKFTGYVWLDTEGGYKPISEDGLQNEDSDEMAFESLRSAIMKWNTHRKRGAVLNKS